MRKYHVNSVTHDPMTIAIYDDPEEAETHKDALLASGVTAHVVPMGRDANQRSSLDLPSSDTETLVFTERFDTGLHFFRELDQQNRGTGFQPCNPASLAIAEKLVTGDKVRLKKVLSYWPAPDDFDLLQLAEGEEHFEGAFKNFVHTVDSAHGEFLVTVVG